MAKKEGSFMAIFVALITSMIIALFWDKFLFIKNAAHFVLDPSAGYLLNWNMLWGMLAIVFFITFIVTLIQKYATDQKTIKEIKEKQKVIQEEMKKHKNNPEKVMEMQRKILEFTPKMIKLSMGGVVYTAIPLILLFRWFFDFFSLAGNYKFFGFLNWFWFYILSSIIFSSILKKIMKVV